MLRSFVPLLGCGVMMAACALLMARAGRGRIDQTKDPQHDAEVAALRDEVARLRAVDERRRGPATDPRR